jgi:hypothetical protein
VALGHAPARGADRRRGFDERPFQIVIDVGAEPTVAGSASTRVDARRGARIRAQFLGAGEPCHVAHLERDHYGEGEPDPGPSRS